MPSSELRPFSTVEVTLAILTISRNRGHNLRQLYESLVTQTATDFQWIIIDDGSTDFTRPLVDSFISEGRIPITYIYKERSGLFSCYLTARSRITAPLTMVVDSDELLPDDSVATVLDTWSAIAPDPATTSGDFSESTAIAGIEGPVLDIITMLPVPDHSKEVVRTSMLLNRLTEALPLHRIDTPLSIIDTQVKAEADTLITPE